MNSSQARIVYDTIVQNRQVSTQPGEQHCQSQPQPQPQPQTENGRIIINNFDDTQFMLNNLTPAEYNSFLNNYHILKKYKQ